jgi:hypothetical protein
VGHLAALEHDVVDAAIGQVLAHGETGLARADDNGRSASHGTPFSILRWRRLS